MTQNQISWLRLQEEMRHNLAEEKENVRSHQASEYIGAGNLNEAQRHNLATEGVAIRTLGESQRHNYMVEYETERSHKASEALSHEANVYNREVGMANISAKRSELAEQHRHNIASEEFNYYNTDANVGVKEQEVAVKQTEAETHQTSVMGEDSEGNITEQKRSNLESESINRARLGIDYITKSIQGFSVIAPYLIK